MLKIEDLMQKCNKFKKVIITCRSQFFPKDEEIPKSTGIIKIKPKKLGESGYYEFGKLYIAPMTDSQVNKFLRKKFSIIQFKERQKARKIIKQILYPTKK